MGTRESAVEASPELIGIRIRADANEIVCSWEPGVEARCS
jgi:hypothetical protein